MESPGQISKKLNAVINLEDIDNLLSDVASEVRKTKSVLDLTQVRLDEAREKKQSLRWIRKIHKDFVLIEREREENASESHRTTLLETLLSEQAKHGRRLKSFGIFAARADMLVSETKTVIETKQSCETLEGLIVEHKRNSKAAAKKIPDLSELHKLWRLLADFQTKVEDLKDLVSEMFLLKRNTDRLTSKLNRLNVQFQKQFKNRCPVCKQKIQ